MSKRTIIITAFALVLLGMGLIFTRSRVEKPPALSSEVRRAPEQTPAAPAVAITGGEKETRSREGGAHPFCAPGSTLYLTQAQQEYRLGERGPDSPDVQAAQRNGAKAKVTLRVVDSRGNPVPDADVKVAFFHRGPYSVDGKTDENGFFTAKHMSESDVHFHASKEGYYRTYRNYWFYREGKPCAKDGRWIPWNPTLEVVLKEKRNPIRLLERTADIELPARGKRYGFDFAVGELVAPDGKGEHADIWLFCDGDMSYPPTQNFTNELIISTSQPFAGFVRRRKDMWSKMIVDYEAPEDGYSHQFLLKIRRSTDKIFEKMELGADEYLIFRTRINIQPEDQVCANYGMIFGPIHYGVKSNDREGARVILHYFFNTTIGDKNLESGPKDPKDRIRL